MEDFTDAYYRLWEAKEAYYEEMDKRIEAEEARIERAEIDYEEGRLGII